MVIGVEAAIKIYRFSRENGAYKFLKTFRVGGTTIEQSVDREKVIEELREEAAILETLKKCKSPHIIEFYEFNEKMTYVKRNGSTVEVAAIFMELAKGGDLSGYISRTDKFTQAFVKYYFAHLISGKFYSIFL